jgi:hypothetical protein
MTHAVEVDRCAGSIGRGVDTNDTMRLVFRTMVTQRVRVHLMPGLRVLDF